MLKGHLFQIIFPVIILAFLGSCCDGDDESPVGPSTPSEVIPLTLGNYWVSFAEIYLNDSLVWISEDDTIAVDTTIVWNNETWYGYTQDDETSFLRNGEGGLWFLEISNQYPDGRPSLIFKHPASVGDQWAIDPQGDSLTVLSVTESVTTPAGNFDNCYLVENTSSQQDVPILLWYKPGVGPVQGYMEYTESGFVARNFLKLKDYHLN